MQLSELYLSVFCQLILPKIQLPSILWFVEEIKANLLCLHHYRCLIFQSPIVCILFDPFFTILYNGGKSVANCVGGDFSKYVCRYCMFQVPSYFVFTHMQLCFHEYAWIK